MDSRLRSVGVVLAGGVGSRVGLGTPKQLATVAGRTILEHAIAVFDGAPEIDEVVVVMTPGRTGPVRELVERAGLRKVGKIVEGGASRTESTWRALQALGREECDVLLHDAARPLLEPQIITECVRALREHVAVEVAIPSSDTIFVAGPRQGGEVIEDVLDRSRLRRAQTPQCFRLSVIREAYERAMADPGFASLPATDDSGVVLRYLPEVPIHLVAGSERNLKVTHPLDLHIAERLLELGGDPAPVAADLGTALDGRTLVIFSDGAGGPGEGGGEGGPELESRLAALARRHDARVRVFSRARDGLRVTDPEAVAKALAQMGRVDFVVNAAGLLPPGRLADAGDDALGAGFLGPVTVARAAYPHLRETGGGLLLYAAGPDRGLASSAGAGVAALVRTLAGEWAEEGVRVNCLDPAGPAGAVARASLDVLTSGRTGRVTASPAL